MYEKRGKCHNCQACGVKRRKPAEKYFMTELLIGTSGYDYPEWKGVFYPEDLKRKDFLNFYASQFNALVLNNDDNRHKCDSPLSAQ